jgi:hypothetical protein
MKPVPAYTSSLDAALALVPDGWSIHQLQRRNDCKGNFTGWTAELYRATDVVLAVSSYGTAATAALALCAAAMRVRQALADADVPEDMPIGAGAAAMRVANGGVLLRSM